MVYSATLNMASLFKFVPLPSSPTCQLKSESTHGFLVKPNKSITKLVSPCASFPRSCSNGAASSAGDVHRQRGNLESLFCYDKAIPEERIEKPVGISLAEKLIGDNPRCNDCLARGAVLCTTCCGSGLYVDSILESQGIIVKVRCLGCGGTGNVMCSECGGRGHVGLK